MKSASPSALKYWVEYEYTENGKPGKRTWDTLATSPVQALNWFHNHAQKERVWNWATRQLLRGKMKPQQYRITLFQRAGLSPYDLPATPNPDLSAKKPKPAENCEFEFTLQCNGVGRLSA